MKRILFLFILLLVMCTTGLMAISINPSVAGNYYKGLTYNPYGLQTVNATSGATTFTYINTTASGNGMMFVAVDPSGMVWTTDYGAPGIPAAYVFDKNGGEVSFSPILFGITAAGETTKIIQPGGVAYNPMDNLMYVVSRDTSNISHIFRFDRTTGAPTTGLIDGIFGNPGSVAIDTAGNVFWQNKVGSDFVTINYLTGATTSVTPGTGGGNNRGCGVSADGSTFYQANDITNLVHVYTGSIAAGYTLATTITSSGACSGVDVIDDKFAVSKTSAYQIDLYQVGTYAYITSIDLQNSSLLGLGAKYYGPIKPRGVAISSDSTRLFVANFSSVGPQIGVIPLDYTSILVDNGGSGDFTTVGAAIGSINSSGTYAAGTAPFVINIKAGSGPYDEILTLDESSTSGQILGDLLLQSDTPGSKVNIKLQKSNNGNEGLKVYQSIYDVTFRDIIFSYSTTKKATSTLIRVQETSNNINYNWINMFDCVLTDIDTTNTPMAVSKEDAIAKLKSVIPSGSGATTGVYLLSINQVTDTYESRNSRIVNSAFYGPLMGAIRVYNYGHNGDIVLLRDDLMVNCGNTAGYAAGCRIGNGNPYYGYFSIEGSNLPTYGPLSCFAVLGANYHSLYLTFYPVYTPMNVKNVICHSFATSGNIRALSSGAATAPVNVTNAIFDTSPGGPAVLGSVPAATLNNVVIGKNSGLLAFGGLGPLTFNNCIVTGSLNQNSIPTGGYFFNNCGLPFQGDYKASGSTLGSASALFTNIQRADPLFSQVTDPTDPATYYRITNQYYSSVTSAGGLLGALFIGGSTPATYPEVPIDRILKSINSNGRNTFGGATITVVGAAAQASNLDPTRLSRYLIDTTTGLGVLADKTGGVATNPSFNIGDIMKITGTVLEYNGLCEFTPYGTTTSENLGASGYTFTTTALTAVQLNLFDQNRSSGGELYEGRFISLSNVTVLSEVTVASGSDANISVTDPSGDTTVIRIDKDAAGDDYLATLNGGVITVGSTIDQVRGIATQYDSSDPRSSGYQILPSEQADFVNVVIFVPVKDWMLY